MSKKWPDVKILKLQIQHFVKSSKDCQLNSRQELCNRKSKCRSENNEFKVLRNDFFYK